MSASNAREALLQNGYCLANGVVPPELLAALRGATEDLLAQQSAEERSKHRSTGSMINVMAHPVFADLIALPPALEALAAMGFPQPKFTSGYVISKPPKSPRLFWHYDWAGWDDPGAFDPVPQQVFLMYYLVDTSPHNGCLRVVPGSHIHDNPLHALLDEAHSEGLLEARDPANPAFSTRPDEADVCVQAGDLVIGDSRILHASHANDSGDRRTVITLWYHPDMSRLDERTQAFIANMAARPPADWPTAAQDKLAPLLATYTGTAEPLPWNRRRPLRVT